MLAAWTVRDCALQALTVRAVPTPAPAPARSLCPKTPGEIYFSNVMRCERYAHSRKERYATLPWGPKGVAVLGQAALFDLVPCDHVARPLTPTRVPVLPFWAPRQHSCAAPCHLITSAASLAVPNMEDLYCTA